MPDAVGRGSKWTVRLLRRSFVLAILQPEEVTRTQQAVDGAQRAGALELEQLLRAGGGTIKLSHKDRTDTPLKVAKLMVHHACMDCSMWANAHGALRPLCSALQCTSGPRLTSAMAMALAVGASACAPGSAAPRCP